MKTIKLFFDFEFTSLSPDAQPISVGIVSEEIYTDVCPFCRSEKYIQYMPSVTGVHVGPADYKCDDCKALFNSTVNQVNINSKSFYAEFSDFDLNRCDDWVKENVVGKLIFPEKLKQTLGEYPGSASTYNNTAYLGNKDVVIKYLKEWLTQFSDYQIQFICDCGTFDWYWMLQLLAEWEDKLKYKGIPPFDPVPACDKYRTGLPKLPTNISPVPEDLNDLIARVKGISVREAFDLNREELAYLKIDLYGESETECFGKRVGNTLEIERIEDQKHNALWDARVIKEIYQKLK